MVNSKQALFTLGEEEYGFDIMDVNIIEKVIPVEPVAKFPKNLKGVINLRGDIIPVYSLRRKFGLADKETDDNTRFIITTTDNLQIAYEIDSMKEIVQLEEDQSYEVPSVVKNADTSYIQSVTSVNERLVLVLNRDTIISEEELAKVREVLKK